MSKFLAVLQLLLAISLAVIALATIYNMALIAQRPDSISVVNVLVAGVILVPMLAAGARILLRRGLANLRPGSVSAVDAEDGASD